MTQTAKPSVVVPVAVTTPATPAKPARFIVRNIAALPAMLAIVAMVGPVRADPVNYPLPSNAELHSGLHDRAIRYCAAHHFTSPHYEGHGEWNCAPRAYTAWQAANLAP